MCEKSSPNEVGTCKCLYECGNDDGNRNDNNNDNDNDGNSSPNKLCNLTTEPCAECGEDCCDKNCAAKYPGPQKGYGVCKGIIGIPGSDLLNGCVNLAASSPSTENCIVDSGATHHVTRDASNVAQGTDYAGPGKLIVGNGSSLDICQTGQSALVATDRLLIINDLLHVPDVTKNLLSVSKLARDNGLFFEFHAHCCSVRDETLGAVLLRGKECNGLYQFAVDSICDSNNSIETLVATKSSSLPLVHGRSRVCSDSMGANSGCHNLENQEDSLISHTVSDSIASSADLPAESAHDEPSVRVNPIVDQPIQDDNIEVEASSDRMETSSHGTVASANAESGHGTTVSFMNEEIQAVDNLGGHASSTHETPVIAHEPVVVAPIGPNQVGLGLGLGSGLDWAESNRDWAWVRTGPESGLGSVWQTGSRLARFGSVQEDRVRAGSRQVQTGSGRGGCHGGRNSPLAARATHARLRRPENHPKRY
ncbi:hypothetical protein GQ457_18G004600 [Hibiscus cannabinus]